MQGFYLLAMRRMRRQKRIALAACLLALLCAGAAARTQLSAAVPAAAELPAAPYIAQSENDRLIVTRGGQVVVRTAIDTRTLPQADRQALAEGILLPDAAALARLLEDYSG